MLVARVCGACLILKPKLLTTTSDVTRENVSAFEWLQKCYPRNSRKYCIRQIWLILSFFSVVRTQKSVTRHF